MEFLLLVMIFVNAAQMILLVVIFRTKQQFCVRKKPMSKFRKYDQHDLDQQYEEYMEAQHDLNQQYEEYMEAQYDEYMEAMYQEHLEYEWRFNYDGAPGEFIILCA